MSAIIRESSFGTPFPYFHPHAAARDALRLAACGGRAAVFERCAKKLALLRKSASGHHECSAPE